MERFSQGGVTNIFYPEAIQLSEDVVLLDFMRRMAQSWGYSIGYRTRVT
ncbi:MAG: hypothetical protein Ct9H300mP3_06970 [Gammaproteobacteria bacterium]|nr:MAG: hypothetical protein Ct9H300mP3_06970 [Gammaproteobacteria bacterium]